MRELYYHILLALSTKIHEKIGRNLFGDQVKIPLAFLVLGGEMPGKSRNPRRKTVFTQKKEKSFDITGVNNREIMRISSVFWRIIGKLDEICRAKILFKNVVYRYNKTAKVTK